MFRVVPKTGFSDVEDLEVQLTPLAKKKRLRQISFHVLVFFAWLAISCALASFFVWFYRVTIADLTLAPVFGVLGAIFGLLWSMFSLLLIYNKLPERQSSLSTFLFERLHYHTKLDGQISHLENEIEITKEAISKENERIAAENERIATEKEESAIRTLLDLESKLIARRRAMLEIEDAIKYKRKWRPEFDKFPLILEENERADVRDRSLARQILKDVRRIHPDHDSWIRKFYDDYSFDIYYRNYRWLEWRLRNLRLWKPGQTEGANRPNDQIKTGSVDNEKTTDHQQPRDPRPDNEDIGYPEDDSFSLRPITFLPEIVEPPPPIKRRELNKILPKMSFDEYMGAARNNMNIGEIGEIIVLHYEISRVLNEMGVEASKKVMRVSESSDSYGYDIKSLSSNGSVFIEVKSTRNNFDSEMYFTENERSVMEREEDNYWLYRVFEISIEDETAKLSIFRGRDEIVKQFNLEPIRYKLVQKPDGELANPTLFDFIE